MMRIRKPFAGGFIGLCLAAAYLGLAPTTIPTYKQSDKLLHFFTFFLLTLTFYWILETTRRRALNFTLSVCTAGLGVGSEVLQGLLPNDRLFDYLDIVANVIGSLAALGACAWYHNRMLDRKRAAKGYRATAGDEEQALEEDGVELDEGTEPQESGIAAFQPAHPTVDEELDNWDENVEDDWDEPALSKGLDEPDKKTVLDVVDAMMDKKRDD